MADYNGKNKTKSSIQLAFDRSKFRSERMAEEEKVMKDFTSYENHHYGRIDNLMNVIYVNDSSIKDFSSQRDSRTVSAMNFVVDAFQKVRTRFKMAQAVGHIPSDLPYLSNPTPYRGYEDPQQLYANYIKPYFQSFNNIFLKNQRITTFDEYYEMFYKIGRAHV